MLIIILFLFYSLYRSVLEPSPSFGPDGSPSPGPSAVFSSLPLSPLFTLSLDVPHSWMVQSTYSPYDLDNIHMASVEREVYGEYQLEYILVEGIVVPTIHNVEVKSPNPMSLYNTYFIVSFRTSYNVNFINLISKGVLFVLCLGIIFCTT